MCREIIDKLKEVNKEFDVICELNDCKKCEIDSELCYVMSEIDEFVKENENLRNDL